MPILVTNKVHRVGVFGQRRHGRFAIGQDHRVEQKARLVFKRRVGLKAACVVSLNGADMGRDQSRRSALCQQGRVQLHHGRRRHAGCNQQCHLAAANRSVARPRQQRQRGRLGDLGFGGVF